MLRPLCLLLVVVILLGGGACPSARAGLTPQTGSLEVRVTARRSLWEFDYGGGVKSIGQLRLPMGRLARLTLTAVDTAHRFHAPDLKLKADVSPRKVRTLWFTPRAPGAHKIACARDCGAGQVNMAGEVLIMEAEDFGSWLLQQQKGSGGAGAALGRDLFGRLGCGACHAVTSTGGPLLGPRLSGVFGSQRRLSSGAQTLADEAYLRESVLRPAAKISAGFQPVMPPFDGVLDDRQLGALILYLKSLK